MLFLRRLGRFLPAVFAVVIIYMVIMPVNTYAVSFMNDVFEDKDGWDIFKHFVPVSGKWEKETVFDDTKINGVSSVYSQDDAYSSWHWSYTGNSAWKDYETEVRLQQVDGDKGSLGFQFRRRNARNFYHLYLNSDNYLVLEKTVNGGVPQVISSALSTWDVGQWYTLKAVAIGTSITCYVDSVQKMSVTDSSLSNGMIALTSKNGHHHFASVIVNSRGVTTAPTITDIRVVNNNTGISATINWNTDQVCTGTIEYGTTVSLGQTAALDDFLVCNHYVGLRNLSPGTTCYYRIRTKNGEGVETVSSIASFATPALVVPAARDTSKKILNLLYYWYPINSHDAGNDNGSDEPFSEERIPGYTDIKFYEENFMTAEEGQTDVILPTYWGDIHDRANWYPDKGMHLMVQAIRNLREKGYKPPLLACFYDVTALQYYSAWNNLDVVDLTRDTKYRQQLYKDLKSFFDTVPDDCLFKYADSNGDGTYSYKYVVYLYGMEFYDFATLADNSLVTYLQDKFAQDFPGRKLYLVPDRYWYNITNNAYPTQMLTSIQVQNANNYWVWGAPNLGDVSNPAAGARKLPDDFLLWDPAANSQPIIANVGPASNLTAFEEPSPTRTKPRRDGARYTDGWDLIISGWPAGANWVTLSCWVYPEEGYTLGPAKEWQYKYVKLTHDKALQWRSPVSRTVVQPNGSSDLYLLSDDQNALKIMSDAHLAAYGLTSQDVQPVSSTWLTDNGYRVAGTAAKWFIRPSDSGMVYFMSSDTNATTAYPVISMDQRYVLGGWSDSAVQVVTPTWLTDNGKTVADYYDTALVPGDRISESGYWESPEWGQAYYGAKAFDRRKDKGVFGWISPHTPSEADPDWLQINFAYSKTISRIELDDTLALAPPQDFKMQYSSDGVNWSDFSNVRYSIDGGNTFNNITSLNMTGNTNLNIIFQFDSVNVWYVKYTVTAESGGNWASMSEIDIQ